MHETNLADDQHIPLAVGEVRQRSSVNPAARSRSIAATALDQAGEISDGPCHICVCQRRVHLAVTSKGTHSSLGAAWSEGMVRPVDTEVIRQLTNDKPAGSIQLSPCGSGCSVG